MDADKRTFEYWMPEQGLDDISLRQILSMVRNDDSLSSTHLDGDQLLVLSRSLNVQPLVYDFLRSLKDGHLAKTPWFQSLRVDALKIAGAEAFRCSMIKKIAVAMTSRGVNPILLKGPALAYTIYPQAHWRTFLDVDLLIHPAEWEAAVHRMQQLGFQPVPCLNWGYLSFEKAFDPVPSRPESLSVELHLKLSNHACLNVFDYDELWHASEIISHFGDALHIPGRVHHFVYLCLHRIGHFPKDRRFIWLMDLDLFAKAFSESEWRQLLDLAIKKKVSQIVFSCLLDVMAVLNTTIPKFVLESLKATKVSQVEPSNRYLLNRHSKAIELFHRWLEIPTVRQRFGFLVRWLIPPRAFMNANFGQKAVFSQHAQRIEHGLRKYLLKE